MRRLRSYTSIWNVEKVLYSLNDLQLPFPVTFVQIAWFVGVLFLVILFGDIVPVNNVLFKYIVLPAGTAWFMSRKAFDGKKPYSFLRSVVLYAFRPKVTYLGKPVKCKKIRVQEKITAVTTEEVGLCFQ